MRLLEQNRTNISKNIMLHEDEDMNKNVDYFEKSLDKICSDIYDLAYEADHDVFHGMCDALMKAYDILCEYNISQDGVFKDGEKYSRIMSAKEAKDSGIYDAIEKAKSMKESETYEIPSEGKDSTLTIDGDTIVDTTAGEVYDSNILKNYVIIGNTASIFYRDGDKIKSISFPKKYLAAPYVFEKSGLKESFDPNEENTMEKVRNAVKENPKQGSILIKSYNLGDNSEADLRYYPSRKVAEIEYYTDGKSNDHIDELKDFSLDMSDEEVDKLVTEFLGLNECKKTDKKNK